MVEVRVFGDEFYQRVETPEGYTLIREPGTEWIVFARLSKDQSKLESTGIKYLGPETGSDAAELNLEKHLDINKEARLAVSLAMLKALGPKDNPRDPKPRGEVVGEIIGVTLLVDFSDEAAVVPAEHVEQMMNGDNFYLYGNRGSSGRPSQPSMRRDSILPRSQSAKTTASWQSIASMLAIPLRAGQMGCGPTKAISMVFLPMGSNQENTS